MASPDGTGRVPGGTRSRATIASSAAVAPAAIRHTRLFSVAERRIDHDLAAIRGMVDLLAPHRAHAALGELALARPDDDVLHRLILHDGTVRPLVEGGQIGRAHV